MNKKVELLAPAGDKERALFALEYGADAVYLGAKQFSLRARASNFEFSDIEEVVNFAHSRNKKVYIVTNIICHDFNMSQFEKFFDTLTNIKVDGFIVADPFIFYNLKNKYKNIELHISTQQSITNSKSALFWKRNGASRVVLAREIKFDELKQTTDNLKDQIEVEVFIHGAVCISFSGRCMMSNNYSLRDANVGGCAQSCRWEYQVLNNDTDKFFTMSAKDMVYLKDIDKLLKLNIQSFKIEGRMKTINYLTTVVKTYRQAIDGKVDLASLQKQIDEVANRATDDAFLYNPNKDKMLYHDEQRTLKQDFIFQFLKKINDFEYEIISKNYFDINTPIKIINPSGPDQITTIKSIIDEENQPIEIVKTPMSKCKIIFNDKIEANIFSLGKINYEL